MKKGNRRTKLGQGLSHRDEGELRIIGGTHRSRRVNFPPEAGVRPTPDRVRQTVFDWLTPWISGARVLDLFAGSGALGFEAVSRGAARARLLENQPAAAKALWQNVKNLGMEGVVTVEQTDTRRVDLMPGGPWDVVFLDPPYDSELWQPQLDRLAEPGLLAPPRPGLCRAPPGHAHAKARRLGLGPVPESGQGMLRPARAGRTGQRAAADAGRRGRRRRGPGRSRGYGRRRLGKNRHFSERLAR